MRLSTPTRLLFPSRRVFFQPFIEGCAKAGGGAKVMCDTDGCTVDLDGGVCVFLELDPCGTHQGERGESASRLIAITMPD